MQDVIRLQEIILNKDSCFHQDLEQHQSSSRRSGADYEKQAQDLTPAKIRELKQRANKAETVAAEKETDARHERDSLIHVRDIWD